MKSYLQKLFNALIILVLLFGYSSPAAAQEPPDLASARALLADMSPEERVGQLFLVSFKGTDLRDTSTIFQLISQYHIGGVVLSRGNNNFSDQENLVQQVYDLTSGLQQIEFQSAQAQNGGEPASKYIPLLIGISQEGDLYPTDQLLSGMTPQASLMAIGATWDSDYAYQTGQVMGSELAALGFNLYLGPSLDVVDGLYREGSQDLGTRTFGGDPYWVSRMAQAYIAGLHSGSSDPSGQSRLAVIAKHFPGMGSADRNPQAEIPTVRKSLDELKRVELAPFFAVTSGGPASEGLVDGLYLSHIRYQGFQGNIRNISTRPISFDQSALNDILKLEPLSQWRADGGLLVSDNLGSLALRSFFDPSGNNFDARQVARNALMAGNDLLYADGLVSSTDPDSFTTLSRTIEFFTQTYRDDAAFAQRVDAAAERILRLKIRLYPTFAPENVTPSTEGLASIGHNAAVTAQVAAQGATLISPDQAELANILSRAPASNERILFITDDLTVRQCDSCQQIPTIETGALQSAVLKLYGTQVGGVISRNLLESYSFTDLNKLFIGQLDPQPIEESIRIATWIVVILQGEDDTRPESFAFSRLLSERPDLLRNKRVVAFAMGAPYYLDATDISKLSAYYGLYAKSQPFIELTARILFQEHFPFGASPVSIYGVDYDLVEAVQPDPNQIISLSLDSPPESASTLAPTAVPSFKLGDTLRLRTSLILDHNLNPVPDGTVVRFSFSVGDEPGLAQVIEAQTMDGVARVDYKIERGELLEISASSQPALNSTRLILDITGSESAVITVIAPTPLPSLTPSPTETPEPTPTITVTPEPPPPPPTTNMRDWVLSLLLAIGAAALVTWLGYQRLPPRWAFRLGLCTLVGALLGYTYLALDFPGSSEILAAYAYSASLIASFTGALIGATSGWFWQSLVLQRRSTPTGPFTPSRSANPSTNPPTPSPSSEDRPSEKS